MTNENYNSFFPDLTNISKILVVDDDTINLFLVRTIIQELLPNSNLIEATNGKEAIDIFQKENPDLIILDIQMPEMNGLEATIEIRKLEKEKRICKIHNCKIIIQMVIQSIAIPIHSSLGLL